MKLNVLVGGAALSGLLGLAGCASTSPQEPFADVNREVVARTGQPVRWMLDDSSRGEIEKAVAELLQTNLTAETSVRIALLNNRRLQAEFESIGISQAELAQATRLKNPELSGSWRVPSQPPRVVNADYGLAQDFLDLLMLPARKKIAARQLEATKLRVAHEVLRLNEETRTAFYMVQAQQQITQHLALVVEVNEAAAEVARRQHEAGNINDLELQSQQVTFAQARLDLAKAQAQTRALRERFNRLLGLSGSQIAWTISNPLPALPEKELPLDEVESIAAARRLDLAAARSDAQAVARALKLKKNFRYLPGASVGIDAEHDLDHSWIVGPNLTLEVPLFDQGQAAIAKLSSEHRRALRTYEALSVNIRSEVREARDALLAARETADFHARVLLPQRQGILREMLLHYNAMQKSNFDLLTAKEREQLAQREGIEALRDYWIARATLETAVGGSLVLHMPVPPSDKAGTLSAPQSSDKHQHP